jgi:hydrogenase maturation protein HypF
VRNLRGDVAIVACGAQADLDAFTRGLVERAPPLAQPRIRELVECPPPAATGFEIAPSDAADAPQVSVPPDFFACEDCIAELADPADRRHRYPFINCTQCGPRYTLIEALPYDRPNTSMARFVLCPECQREYEDPLDRRFHAEPVACPVCGPHLSFAEPGRPLVMGDEAALAAAVEILRNGRVLAARGIGGYHLLCDARSEAAVQRLRDRKRRPDKPLAVMFPQAGHDGLDAARRDLDIAEAERTALLDPARPIAVRRKPDCAGTGRGARPRRDRRLRLTACCTTCCCRVRRPGGCHVRNVSGEPVLTEPAEVEQRRHGC